jgi:predicted nucleic acid-binding protein
MGLTVVDAGVLIGFLDRNDAHHDPACHALAEEVDVNNRIVLPASAFAEMLVGPYRRGDDAVATVRQVIEQVPIDVAPLDDVIAARAASLRAMRRALKLPDALVVATAAALDADRLITTDRGWPTRRQLGIRAALVVL